MSCFLTALVIEHTPAASSLLTLTRDTSLLNSSSWYDYILFNLLNYKTISVCVPFQWCAHVHRPGARVQRSCRQHGSWGGAAGIPEHRQWTGRPDPNSQLQLCQSHRPSTEPLLRKSPLIGPAYTALVPLLQYTYTHTLLMNKEVHSNTKPTPRVQTDPRS